MDAEYQAPSVPPPKHGPAMGWIGSALLRWLSALALFVPLAAVASACTDAPLLLVHPKVTSVYEDAIAQLAQGLEEARRERVGVCAIDDLPKRPVPTEPKAVVAVGEKAVDAAAAVFRTPIVAVLVRDLPPGARRGLSLFIAPDLFLRQLRALSPETRTVRFVHRADAPSAVVDAAEAAARALGMRLVPQAVSTIREAALAVEMVLGQAEAGEAFWFHRGVLAMNPEILLPKIVRLSWERRVPVFDEEAEYVARGLLFALTHDYLELGRAAAAMIEDAATGIVFATQAKRILNGRTARAIGIPPRVVQEQSFNYVYE